MKDSTIAMIVIAIAYALFVLPIVITGFVYAGINFNATCDGTTIIRLPVWLIVSSAITLVEYAVLIPLWCVYAANESDVIAVVIRAWVIISGSFNVAWIIVGSVKLFKYGMSCRKEAYSLWAMSLAVLILGYIGILSAYSRARNNKK